MGRRISLVWTGDETLRLRFTIPAGWEKMRAWKLGELLLERLEGQPRAVGRRHDVAAGWGAAAAGRAHLDTGRGRVRARGAATDGDAPTTSVRQLRPRVAARHLRGLCGATPAIRGG